MSRPRYLRLWCSLILGGALFLAACGGSQPVPDRILETVVVTQVVEVPSAPIIVTEIVEIAPDLAPAEAPGPGSENYRIAVFGNPPDLNYWHYQGTGYSPWTKVFLDGAAARLYTLSDQRFDFVPELAKFLPPAPVQEADFWTITIEMEETASWSDGEPLDATDVVFTLMTCLDLRLPERWASHCQRGNLAGVELVDDYAVKFLYDEKPGLREFHASVALGPILPEHFWGGVVAETLALVEDVDPPNAPLPADCSGQELSEEAEAACERWAAYEVEFQNAHLALFRADPTGQPVYGSHTLDQFEPGAFAVRTANDLYFLKGARITQFDDGTWMREMPDGSILQLYGNASGEKTIDFTKGPFIPTVTITVYGTPEDAYQAFLNGEVDYVYNPEGPIRGLDHMVGLGRNILAVQNAAYDMYYLGFNLREEPMALPEFREALEIMIDKELVINQVLQGGVIPLVSTMPAGNGFWHNPRVPTPYRGYSHEARLETAVALLSDAGWTWDVEPSWDPVRRDVNPGEGLALPGGQPVPELTILGPGATFDPVRATFNYWIAEWARELGIPVQSELTGRDEILDRIFALRFDMFILGWTNLGDPAFPEYFDTSFHSRWDTGITGGFNFPGYVSPEYDALAEEFLSTDNIERARELVFEMQLRLANDRPYIPLYSSQFDDLVRDHVVFPYNQVLGGFAQMGGFPADVQINPE